MSFADTLSRLSNGGLLEQGLPCRRYKYQLVDPVDEPYASFRFYYRTFGELASCSIDAITKGVQTSSRGTVFSIVQI